MKFADIARTIANQRKEVVEKGLLARPSTISSGIDELRVMRRWNSFTPLTSRQLNSQGGGYVLSWQGSVTVIDPGYGFISLYDTQQYSLVDIRCIIVTHDHPDHCEDLLRMLTLLKEMNEIRNQEGLDTHPVKLFLSYGAYARSQVVLETAPIKSFVDPVRVLPPRDYDLVSDLGFRFCATVCEHNELLGDSTTFGVRLDLHGKTGRRCCRLSITSDTAYHDDIADQYESSDILAAHIGTVEQPGSHGLLSSHLGTRGIRRLITRLEKAPRLTVLTEWGEECYGQRVSVRDFLSKQVPDTAMVPADVWLRIQLPSCRIGLSPAGGYAVFEEMTFVEDGADIHYLKRT